jgi:diguanylate cyclase (GGDEF)-like protein
MMTQLLEHAIAYSRRAEGTLALLFLDLDDFKRVNDTLGHEAGDQLLEQVSERLAVALRASDWIGRASEEAPPETIARIGGDEFIIILPNVKGEDGARIVARRVLAKIATPFQLCGHEFHVTSSIGVALCPRDAETAEELIRRADQAMYHAKDHGKNGYEVYSEGMNSLSVERLAIENALHKALDNDEFCLHYQPQIDLRTGALVGAEALLRWNNPELGQVPPAAFIPVAEECGLIVPIGEWVLREACRRNVSWQESGLAGLSVSVNISPRQFNRPNFEATVAASLEDSGLDGRFLCIELTETCVMASDERGSRTLSAIKDLGVQISMDDFGTGYSSLSALRRLPIDELKIDQSFVREMTSDSSDASIISTIIAMGRSLSLRVVAEGVEKETQLELLRGQGCHLIQGYLIGRPLPVAEFASFAARCNSSGHDPKRVRGEGS